MPPSVSVVQYNWNKLYLTFFSLDKQLWSLHTLLPKNSFRPVLRLISKLLPKKPEGIQDHRQGRKCHGPRRDRRGNWGENSQRQSQQVIAKGPKEVLPDNVKSCPGNLDCLRYFQQVPPHQHNISRFFRHVRPRPQG